MNLSILGFVLLITSCFFTPQSVKRIFSEPHFLGQDIENNLTVMITNGFSGRLKPFEGLKSNSHLFQSNDEVPNLWIGGKDAFGSYLKISKEKYGPSLLLLDSGNIFSSDSRQSEIEEVLNLYELIGFDGVGLAEREINILKPFENEREFKIPFILSNLVNIKKMKHVEKSNIFPYIILEKGPYKIGIISITGKEKFPPGLYVEDPVFAVIKIKKIFRQQKVDFTVLMADIRSKCISGPSQKTKVFQDFEKHQLKCPKRDPLLLFVNRLPSKSVDLVVSNNNLEAQGFIKTIPVIQTPGEGKFIARAVFNIPGALGKIDRKNSQLLPPILTCNNFFKSTEDCYLGKGENYFSKENARMEIIRKSYYKIIPASYLGSTIPLGDNLVTN